MDDDDFKYPITNTRYSTIGCIKEYDGELYTCYNSNSCKDCCFILESAGCVAMGSCVCEITNRYLLWVKIEQEGTT